MEQTALNRLITCLTRAAHEVAKGNYKQVGTIFELTREGDYPEEIAALAEAFGMMIVKVDAKQLHLERLIEDLSRGKDLLEKSLSRLMVANLGMLEVLGSAIAKRDSNTNAHNYRVTSYAIQLGRVLGLDDDTMRSLIKGSFLHDLGKIAISDAILHKPGKLTVEEFEIMKTHVTHGNDILHTYEWLHDAAATVLHHHEKFDGNGYPDGLKGNKIPLIARVFAIVDVFDALTSQRPYKKPVPYQQTMEIMAADCGTHFDPDIFSVFSGIARDLHEEIADMDIQQIMKRLHILMRDYYQAEHFSGAQVLST